MQLEHGVGALCDERRHKEGNGGHEHHDERDAPVEREHEAERPKDGDHAGEKLREAHEQPFRELIRIRDDAAYEFAVGMSVKIPERQVLDVRKRRVAQALHRAIGNAVVADGKQPLGERGQPNNGRHAHGELCYGREIHLPGRDDVVDCVANEDGEIQRERDGERRKQQGKRHEPPIGADVSEHAAERAGLCLVVLLHRLRLLPCGRGRFFREL